MLNCVNGSLKGSLSVGQGERGEQGPVGESGKSAYEIAIQNGFVGTEEAWLISLKGDKGDIGPQGIQGLPGKDGANGADGKDGITPNIQIGEVTTLEPNQQATVTRRGDNENPILDFGIPKGKDGMGGGSAGGTSIDDTTISTETTWSSAKIEDFVLTNDDVVWTDVSGENLSIDYTKEGHLREVEIWGNTIQNEEDLSDIQHLGELYVDDEGEPILDDLGREQYKLEIESCNKNLFSNNIDDWEIGSINGTTGENIVAYTKIRTKDFIKIPKGSIIFWKKNNLLDKVAVRIYDKSKKCLYGGGFLGGNATKLPHYDEAYYLRFVVAFSDESVIMPQDIENFIVQFEVSSIETSYISHQSHKTTILLPCQLMKVGDIKDRLYWDSEKGKYVVEKNVMDIVINSNDFTYGLALGTGVANNGTMVYEAFFKDTEIRNNFNNNVMQQLNKPVCLMSIVPFIHPPTSQSVECFTYDVGWKVFQFRLSDDKVGITTVKGFSDYVDSIGGIPVYVGTVTPQLIETNITEQIKLPTYKDKTHIFVNSWIDGSIKCKAPLNGGQAILSLSQENKELQSVNQTQDELINTTMLATDEMFMMLEPLLANTYNIGGNEKMVDLYVVMCMRGLKKIEDVPVRYREQVAEILNKLEE